jgi:multicomponent K+:H+ antiporter subunit C
LPQALVLTAIVIAFGMTAFVIMLALKAKEELGNDHVDGRDAADGQPERASDHVGDRNGERGTGA